MCQDSFVQAEDWLQNAATPPSNVAQAILVRTPADLQPWTTQPRDEAVAACRRARVAYCYNDAEWRQARVLDYMRWLRGPLSGGDDHQKKQ